MKKILSILAVTLLLILTITFTGMKIWIGSDVKEISSYALVTYNGDKVEALIAVLNAENETLDRKNRAVWALGKLGDERAIPVLKMLRTGSSCDHSNSVCQREVEKALGYLEGRSIDLMACK